jgi:hypothetical protein
VLRSGVDNNVVEMGGLSLSQLEGDNLPAIAQSNPPAGGRSVEIIRGGVESVVAVPSGFNSQPADASSVAGGKADTAPIAPR